MLGKRKEKKAAFMVGDKLYVDRVLWKEQEFAEDGRNINSVKENLKSNKNSLKVCSWNISKGLLGKLADKEFLHEVVDSDIVCFNECWVKYPKEIELDGY